MARTEAGKAQIRKIIQTRCPDCDASFAAPCALSPGGAGNVVVLSTATERGPLAVHAARAEAAGYDVPPAGVSPAALR